ncbi:MULTISPECIES: hypothetical protein [unclassified Brevundimonas]|jgi:hypothetical protein|uniref:hypothetical protein n=1 Tax=unclassified Brevundimonas TaxID=2622653 RepID=UPI0025C40F61|nr:MULTISPECIES: hypothetical protein [unclassified Brevundimonas]
MSLLPINRPVALVEDFGAAVFENVDLTLFEVFAHAARNGPGLIQGRTFKGCRIQGPAIILVSNGVTFDETNFGDSRGDIRNLVLKPVGDKAIGTIPMRDCAFIGCEFYGVGFTGTDEFVAQIVALPNSL